MPITKLEKLIICPNKISHMTGKTLNKIWFMPGEDLDTCGICLEKIPIKYGLCLEKISTHMAYAWRKSQ
jgi:hypothetical protein